MGHPAPGASLNSNLRTMHKGNSALAGIVRNAAAHAHQGNSEDYDSVYHGCGYDSGGCQLAPALEALFAGMLSQKLASRVLQIRPDWKESEVLYAPHLRSERRVGFDYSAGHFCGPKRVRWMHKHASKWCDADLRWNPKSADKPRCRNHALLLLDQLRREPKNMRPFFILSLCFCLHEYRRMGRNGVPAVEDSRRWVIADLRPLAGWTEDQIRAGSFRFVRGADGDSASWMSDAGQMPLPLVSLEQFLEDQAAFLSEGPP